MKRWWVNGGNSEKRTVIIFAMFSLAFAGVVGGRTSSPLIFLPGTQPEHVLPADSVGTCVQCHQTQPGSGYHPTTIIPDWRGSMMGQSARDPIFFAALAVANKYEDTSGEFCIRCHAPSGWLGGRSKNPDGTDLIGSDFDGVQCDHCHRMANPLVPDSTVPIVGTVPGFGNGMFGVQHDPVPKRGPYSDAAATHDFLYDPFIKTGEFCGTCHNVSNPLYAQDRLNQPPHEYGAIERTYSEWLLSWYATQGDAGTCQGCHMQRSPGYGCTLPFSPLRNDLAQHDLTGGNTFVPDILPLFWEGLDTVALQAGKLRARNTLQRAAELDVIAGRSGDSVLTIVRVTNLTGHKLPTGYPEGRRMWINVVGMNASNDTVFQSGHYDFVTGVLHSDAQIKIYEMKPGLTDSIAALYNLPPGPSFHFILNDTIFFDNRIPPRGFHNLEFRSHLAQPVGYTYADEQYWDVTHYSLPLSATRVSVRVYYQTASKEYIEFLRDENIGNPHDWNQWGQNLYNAWNTRGKSWPEIIDSVTVPVGDSIAGFVPVQDNPLPVHFTLLQNYPNPFNPRTVIPFVLQRETDIDLKIYDVAGREIRTLARGRYPEGVHRIEFDGSTLGSGVYLYTLTVQGNTQSKKLLLIK
jgi:hypothetical protein